jgi:uncharacterized membrane protein
MIEQLPQWLQIFLISMIPGAEGKLSILHALHNLNWELWQAFPIAIAGNMILVPFGLLFFKYVEQYFRKFDSSNKLMDRVFSRIRNRTNKKIQRYKGLALIFFVALPLPFTGAGIGVLIAYLFDFKFKDSLIMIFIGVLIATSAVTILYLFGVYLFTF